MLGSVEKGQYKVESFFSFPVIFFLFYLAFGASIFSAIESPYEKQEVQRLLEKKSDFLKQHPCITGFYLFNIAANQRSILLKLRNNRLHQLQVAILQMIFHIKNRIGT